MFLTLLFSLGLDAQAVSYANFLILVNSLPPPPELLMERYKELNPEWKMVESSVGFILT